MEILLLIFGIVTFNIAWRARGEARHARKLIADLEEKLAMLRTPVSPASQPEHADAPLQPFEPVMADRPAPAIKPLTPANPFELVEADWLLPDSPAAVAAPPQPQPEMPSDPKPLPKLRLDSTPETTETPPPRAPRPPPQWLVAAKAWLFGGNLVAKLGLLILFIGVSFLLKYTAARVTVPIELRLAGIVLADLALLAWAWRIRLRRPAISLPVQGAAVAVLMLVTFGAFRLYQLIPSALAFALLLVLTVFTCVLAVLQNAMWLAIFGIAGGFAAPILASSGGGSHIGLFSYYALLNAGVLGLALLRSWRPLNLLGFAFTFSIATAWGAQRYVPENYLSVQLFLLLFFVFYVSIPLAYARRQSVKLKNYVDGTLVFGTPMLGFGLQFTIVRGIEFGVAYSALALGLFYIGLATALRRRDQYALLGDAFLALGVVFGTLAIPFALDGRWTSAAWALEGAGIVWIGLRQKQKLAWIFGLLVQFGAWLSFVGTASGLSSERAADSNLWLGFVLLALTGFMMATRFRAQERTRGFNLLAGVFLAGATVWLVAGAWTEIFLRVDGHRQGTLLVASALLAAAGLYAIARKMAWPLAAAIALAVQAVAGATLLAVSLGRWDDQLDANLLERPLLGSLMIFAGALFSSWALMRQQAGRGTRVFTVYRLMLVWAALWWFGIAAPDLAFWLEPIYEAVVPGDNGSEFGRVLASYALLLAATAAVAVALARGLRWPALRWFSVPVWPALALTTLLTLVALYGDSRLPGANAWIAFAALWLAGEWLLAVWPRRGWRIAAGWLHAAHTVRSAGPWLMIWPVASDWIAGWMAGTVADADVGDWDTGASWARFIPSWLMMAATGWMMQRVRADGWPVRPIPRWYRRCLVPLACIWLALLVGAWNFTQDGGMSPLPYLPLLNPLDLSTCFAIVLLIACLRLQTPSATPAAARAWPAGWIAPAPLAIALFGYAWFNLALLRTVSHYLDVPYTFDSMFASQFVQAMLSLVWSVTALLLMRHAATRAVRSVWIGGAVLLALVVGKLFLVDLSNIGGVERIVSFLGVGALMVGIGYLAPFPTETEKPAETA
ncbi:Predicted membrane protein [Duganella sp. CF517]|uniref:DUF2339 domain-containing protein n=1 Tax=Duganella sp. CF517 TaxID=1881038 RepID=UPI0008B9BE90|nr:DUF2339 domain-containing protein [Duganella sp. CF517]SEO48646.1 Predicted membrane protein [Duganella sp. CF517]